MARAGSHYDRGIEEMRSGNNNQAEWEFDAALETLVDGDLNPAVPPRLIDANQTSSVSLRDWLSPPVTPRQSVNPESPPLDPDEPTQAAPALLGPEDVQAIETEEAKETPPLPEPDVQKYEFRAFLFKLPLRAPAIHGRNLEARKNVGFLLALLGRKQEAIRENLETLALAPQDSMVLTRLAILYFGQGDYSKGVALARRAFDATPGSGKGSLDEFVVGLQAQAK